MIIRNRKQFDEAISKFTSTIVIDIETNGLELWKGDRLCGIGVCTSNFERFYFPFRHRNELMPLFAAISDEHSEKNLPIEWLPEVIKAIEKTDVLIGHNIKFDIAGLHQDGFNVQEHHRLEDTIVLARLYFPDKYEKLDLENVATKVLKIPDAIKWKTEFKNYLKKNKIETKYDYGDVDIVGEYCENDTWMTFQIREKLCKYIEETNQQRVWNQECQLLSVLWEIERDGMYVDLEYCNLKIPLLQNRVTELEGMIWEIIGYEFDINSTDQLDKAMNSIGIYSPLITDKKKASGDDKSKWNLEVLLGIEHPIAKMILQYREAYKILNTYFIPTSKWKDGYIHPSFKSWGTATGRMSCVNPNLQNVATKPIDVAGEIIDPKVQEIFKTMSKSSSVSSRWIGRITKFEEKDTTVSVKRMYIAPKGYHLYCIDFSQMEMRVFSDYVGDPSVIKTLEEEGFDFHSFVAKEVWKSSEDDPNWKFYRSIAKAINFGMIYGIGVGKLSVQIGKTIEEAKQYKDNYFSHFPSALRFMNNVKRTVCNVGFLTNRFSRRYNIPYDKSYTGVNYLVQGSSADLVKNRMIAIWEYLKPYKSRMVAQIHDEIVFYIHESEEHFIVKEIKKIMEERLLKVLLPTEVSKGFPSWGEKAEVCLDCFQKRKVDDKEHICQGYNNKSKSSTVNSESKSINAHTSEITVLDF